MLSKNCLNTHILSGWKSVASLNESQLGWVRDAQNKMENIKISKMHTKQTLRSYQTANGNQRVDYKGEVGLGWKEMSPG